jgi:ribosomal protein S18 acetylase RimI-like enzyme
MPSPARDPRLEYAAMQKNSIRPLSPDLLDDYLSFFDHDAFCDNPEWQSCYCAFFHFYSRARVQEWEERTGEQNRAMVSDLIRAGRMRGYLAFAGAKVAGWCHAAPRVELPSLRERFDLPADEAGGLGSIGSIACFVVAKGHRHQGVARQLLDAACQGFRAMGLSCAEAYPHSGRETDAENYHGPLAMYLAAGFQPFQTRGDLMVVRKALAPDIS